MNEKLLTIHPHARDLGGFSVRRALPNIQKRTISYFVFFDHLGPAEIGPDRGMDVRPHPHIALSTVTYLFSGSILHRDSLGSVQLIEAGDVNWMTAGYGIVHSERTPRDKVKNSILHGLQIWVALPKNKEEMPPSFNHFAKKSLPFFKKDGAQLTLILGEIFGKVSPVGIESNIFYLNANLSAGQKLQLEFPKSHEVGIYLISGTLEISDIGYGDAPEIHSKLTLIVLKINRKYSLLAKADCHFVIFGGEPLPEPRYMWWNFVSSSQGRIENAKVAWASQEMGTVPGETEFIPLPQT